MRLFLATAAALLTLAAPAAAAPTWLEPGFLTEEGGSAPLTALAVAPDGTAVAAWSRDTGGGGRGVEIARRAPGGGFAVVCTPTTGGQNGLTPQVAMDAQGNATIAWAEDPAGTIRATRLPAGASGCETPETVSTGPGNARPALAVGAGGTAVIVYEAPFGGERKQHAVIRGGAGGEFGPDAPISTNTAQFETTSFNAGTVDVAVDPSGTAVAAWARKTASGGFQVEVTVRPAGGAFPASGSSPQTISPTGSQSRPSITIDAVGRATAVWSYDPDAPGTGLVNRIQISERPAGGDFSLGQNVTPLSEDAVTPAVQAAADGSVLGAWMIGSGDNRRIQTAIRQPGGGFGQFATVSPAGDVPGTMSVSVNARGDSMVMWDRSDFAGVFSAFKPAGGAFGPTQTVGERGTPPLGVSFDFFLPSVGLDDQGNAFTVLSHNHFRTGTDHFRVLTRAFDAAPPALTVSVPGSGVASLPVGMAATAVDRLTPATIAWSFGDGASATGGAVSHAFGAAGAFNVTVTATDAVGNATATTAPVLVANPPPPPQIASPVSVKWGRQGRFTYLVAMRVVRPPAGSKVELRCRGRKCPFRLRTFTRLRNGSIRVYKELKPAKVVKKKNRKFRAGQRLQVRVTAAGFIGRVVNYPIRKKGTPTSIIRCLPIGATTPQKTC
jgi:hypothetical protein